MRHHRTTPSGTARSATGTDGATQPALPNRHFRTERASDQRGRGRTEAEAGPSGSSTSTPTMGRRDAWAAGRRGGGAAGSVARVP
jgi:hypothetical protein